MARWIMTADSALVNLDLLAHIKVKSEDSYHPLRYHVYGSASGGLRGYRLTANMSAAAAQAELERIFGIAARPHPPADSDIRIALDPPAAEQTFVPAQIGDMVYHRTDQRRRQGWLLASYSDDGITITRLGTMSGPHHPADYGLELRQGRLYRPGP